MLQGKELGAAAKEAMRLKSVRDQRAVRQQEFAEAMGMTQPSVSEFFKTGRLAKEKIPKLLAFFDGVVGPDYFGLPWNSFEVKFIELLRGLPTSSQTDLFDRLKAATEQIAAAAASVSLNAPEKQAPQEKRRLVNGKDPKL